MTARLTALWIASAFVLLGIYLAIRFGGPL